MQRLLHSLFLNLVEEHFEDHKFGGQKSVTRDGVFFFSKRLGMSNLRIAASAKFRETKAIV